MTLPRVLDQHLVVHVFAPTDGPRRAAAYRGLREIWLGCSHLFAMDRPIPGLGLPHRLPDDVAELPLADEPDREQALAAQQGRTGGCQAVLRVHHDVFNLSVALAAVGAAGGTSTWAALERSWESLMVGRTPDLLGEARIHLASLDVVPDPATADLRELLMTLFPPPDGGSPDAPAGRPAEGVVVRCGPSARAAIWEPFAEDEARATRRLLVAAAAADDDEVGAWLWTRGDPTIPPLARYLLHTSKIRYQLRVWRRDARVRELRTRLLEATTALRELLDAEGSPGGAEVDLVSRRATDAVLMAGDLRQARRTVEIAVDNMALAVGEDVHGPAMGLFAADRAVAGALLHRLADDGEYLDAVVVGGDRIAEAGRQALAGPGPASRPAGKRRNVLVVHGRDLQVRDRMFDFLRSLDLRPLEWESLVAGVGSAAPYVGEVVDHAIAIAQAVVVLLTPEDLVTLHPDLHGAHDGPQETTQSLQARPNVLLELGMSLAALPHRTVIVGVGMRRPIGDLAGLGYVELDDSPSCRRKLVSRLQAAKCLLDDRGDQWLAQGRFAELDAYRRRP